MSLLGEATGVLLGVECKGPWSVEFFSFFGCCAKNGRGKVEASKSCKAGQSNTEL